MKFSVSLEQKDFLRKNGYIAFLSLINPQEINDANREIDRLANEIKKRATASEILHQQSDLFRKSNNLKKIVYSKRLTHLVFELLQKKPLRLAFDRVIDGNLTPELQIASLSLNEFSGISPILGAYLICLKSSEGQAWIPGEGLFLLPESNLKWLEEGFKKEDRFLLIGFTDQYGQYLYQEKDPWNHSLKSLGYVFGDRLHDNLHPLLLR